MDNLRIANRALATPFSLSEAAPASAGVYPQGDYDDTIAYKKGDLVSLDDVAYLSLVDDNEDNTPDSSPNFWEALGGGGGGGGLPTASVAGQVPVSVGAGTVYLAQNPGVVVGLGLSDLLAEEIAGRTIIANGTESTRLTSDGVSTFLASTSADTAVDSVGATRKTLVQSMMGATFARTFRFYAPVSTVVPCGSLSSGDNPLATMTYNGGAKTLTAGINADVTGFGLTLGMSVLFIFIQANQTSSGVYVVTDTGADDPGGAPALFTRRSDFDSSGEILSGACIPVTQNDENNEPGQLYRLQGSGPFTLDVSNLVFVEQKFASPTTVQVTTTNAGSSDGSVIIADTTGGNIQVSLPGAFGSRGPIHVKKAVAANNVTIVPDDPGETIDGATTLVLSAQYASVTLYSDGTKWWIID